MSAEGPGSDPDHEWAKLEEHLASYAFPILVSWIRSGRIRQEAANARIRGLVRVPESLRLADDRDARCLAVEIVVTALRSFRTKRTSWDPQLGRSIESYFVGFCLMKLPDAYKAWARREVVPAEDRVDLDDLLEVADPGRFEDLVDLHDQIRRIVGDDPGIERAVQLREDGFTFSEISRQSDGARSLRTGRKVSDALKKVGQRLHEEESADE
jgi:hypothetical protein